MFEFFFKYPSTAFAKGDLVFLGRWPLIFLVCGVIIAAAALAYPLWKNRKATPARFKPVAIWLLQSAMLALLLLLLWQPALSVATLRPQQNIVAVVLDDSKSMGTVEDGMSRTQRAKGQVNSSFLKELEKKFQVRLYRAGTRLERIPSVDSLKSDQTATRLGDAMKQVVSEATSLPIGAVVLLSDGSDNSGGIDLPTISEIRRHRIPVHTVGFGREKPVRDIEITEAQIPTRALAGSRLAAQVSFTQWGNSGKARLTLKDAGKVIASREVTLRGDGVEQTETLVFQAGEAAARSLQFQIEPLPGEDNVNNNALTRLLIVDGAKPRILYLEGELKWEYKFIRRAIDLDPSLQLTSIIRTTQNKIYRQNVAEPKEFEEGFPAKVEELFKFDGLVIGGIEAGAFTPAQQELIRQFVDRRGGGVLFLGGRAAMSDGGWSKSGLADLFPTALPERKQTFRRDPASAELTPAGRDSLITRLEDDPDRNAERWKKLPQLADFQDPGPPKAGALVLAESRPTSGGKLPLLVTQNYGRGRTALLATTGSWRWQMLQPLEDKSHEMFWQQLLRWVVSGTRGQVITSVPKSVFADDTQVPFRAEVRDKTFLAVSDARVEAHVLGPEGLDEKIELRPDATQIGLYTADWSAMKPGTYFVETVATRGTEEVARETLTFRREDGVAENFHIQQNRELLEKLASQTGGRYYQPTDLGRLSEEISYSEAGISTRETRDLWNMPIIFMTILGLRGAEWLLRRKWGAV